MDTFMWAGKIRSRLTYDQKIEFVVFSMKGTILDWNLHDIGATVVFCH